MEEILQQLPYCSVAELEIIIAKINELRALNQKRQELLAKLIPQVPVD